VDLRAGLDDLEKRKFLTLPGLELRPLNLEEYITPVQLMDNPKDHHPLYRCPHLHIIFLYVNPY
jgi:hypothetical protein